MDKIKNNIIKSPQWKRWARSILEQNSMQNSHVIITKKMMDDLKPTNFFLVLLEASKDKNTKAVAKILEETQFARWCTIEHESISPMEFYDVLQLNLNEPIAYMERLPVLLRYWKYYKSVHSPMSSVATPKDIIDKQTVNRFGPYWKHTGEIAELLRLDFDSDSFFNHPARNVWLDLMKTYLDDTKTAEPLMIKTFQLLGNAAAKNLQNNVYSPIHFAERWIQANLQPIDVVTILGLDIHDSNLATNSAFSFLKVFIEKFLVNHPEADTTVVKIFSRLGSDESEKALALRKSFVSFFLRTPKFTPKTVMSIFDLTISADYVEKNPVWAIWMEYVNVYLVKNKVCPEGPLADTLEFLGSTAAADGVVRKKSIELLYSSWSGKTSQDTRIKQFLTAAARLNQLEL
ncbi:hypothetical protein CCR75_008226 [Bremia lactucae]|uniref:RxLR effector protein n=1 Tax=Bremia lactucae TaxID=4779 RepID=A0A976FP51_BRELC|nr:hypothetical protein CCR75_008226 [Bremia lactucae]